MLQGLLLFPNIFLYSLNLNAASFKYKVMLSSPLSKIGIQKVIPIQILNKINFYIFDLVKCNARTLSLFSIIFFYIQHCYLCSKTQ